MSEANLITIKLYPSRLAPDMWWVKVKPRHYTSQAIVPYLYATKSQAAAAASKEVANVTAHHGAPEHTQAGDVELWIWQQVEAHQRCVSPRSVNF